MLRRLEEQAYKEYPHAKVDEGRVDGYRINPTSSRALGPLLRCFATLAFVLLRLPIALLCVALLLLGFLPQLAWVLVIVLLVSLLTDSHFLHWLTAGRTGMGGEDANAKIHCRPTERNNRIVERLAHFAGYRPPPFLVSGDWLTLAPYVVNKGSVGGRVRYQRWWVRVNQAPAPDGEDGPMRRPTGKDDDEFCALDISFPPGGFRKDKPVFLILHGLNGGSTEPYVLDMTRRANREGSTACVLIARGMAKTHVKGDHVFNGARTSDVGAAVDLLLYAFGSESRDSPTPLATNIVLVGFSMGAITAANYTAKAKSKSGLAGSVCFSGALCAVRQLDDPQLVGHSNAVWQPILAWALKYLVVKRNTAKIARSGLVKAADVEAASSVTDLDRAVIVPVNGYHDVHEYYADMCAAGRGDAEGLKKLAGTAVPMLAVHAVDDPITVYETCLAPKAKETDNVLILTTVSGGHIGWPQGWRPSLKRWDFMTDISMTFAATVCEV